MREIIMRVTAWAMLLSLAEQVTPESYRRDVAVIGGLITALVWTKAINEALSRL